MEAKCNSQGWIEPTLLVGDVRAVALSVVILRYANIHTLVRSIEIAFWMFETGLQSSLWSVDIGACG